MRPSGQDRVGQQEKGRTAAAPPLAVSAALAQSLLHLQVAVLIDVRQPVELELEGRVAGAECVPLFNLKKVLGHALNAEEQEVLDSDTPTPTDVQMFLAVMNRQHYEKGNALLCLCNSGKRSLHAAQLLRSIGYERAFSVEGGVRAWRTVAPE